MSGTQDIGRLPFLEGLRPSGASMGASAAPGVFSMASLIERTLRGWGMNCAQWLALTHSDRVLYVLSEESLTTPGYGDGRTRAQIAENVEAQFSNYCRVAPSAPMGAISYVPGSQYKILDGYSKVGAAGAVGQRPELGMGPLYTPVRVALIGIPVPDLLDLRSLTSNGYTWMSMSWPQRLEVAGRVTGAARALNNGQVTIEAYREYCQQVAHRFDALCLRQALNPPPSPHAPIPGSQPPVPGSQYKILDGYSKVGAAGASFGGFMGGQSPGYSRGEDLHFAEAPCTDAGLLAVLKRRFSCARWVGLSPDDKVRVVTWFRNSWPVNSETYCMHAGTVADVVSRLDVLCSQEG